MTAAYQEIHEINELASTFDIIGTNVLLEGATIAVQPYAFLSALPALLGLAGFVVYQVLGANRSGDEISRRIIEKLRTAAVEAPLDQRLTPKQVETLLERQQRLRALVGEHDFLLLKQALRQQFVLTVFVYFLTLGFCAWSVYLFIQPQKTSEGGAPIFQNSLGNKSPNIVSSGGGAVTVVQGQAKPVPAALSQEHKK